MLNFPTLFGVRSEDKTLESKLNVLIRKVKEALVSASGAGKLTNADNTGLAYGMHLAIIANSAVVRGLGSNASLGVNLRPGTTPIGALLDAKSVGEADCLFMAQLPPFSANSPIWLDPVQPGYFTTVPQQYPCCGLIINSQQYGTTGLCLCALSLPRCVAPVP